MDYKNHRLHVSVRSFRHGRGWTADVYVMYSETGKNVLHSLRMAQTFHTPSEAEQAGVEYAKKWIDDGKPNPMTMTRQEIEQKMDELAREYHDTHDPEIPEEIFELARR